MLASAFADIALLEIQQLPFSRPIPLERAKPASTGRPVNGPTRTKNREAYRAAANLLRRIRAAVDTYFIYRRMLRASRSTSLRFALKRLALSATAGHFGQSHWTLAS